MTTRTIGLEIDVLAQARKRAAQFRQARQAEGTLVVHLMSSPGAGKTSLLEATARRWQGVHSLAVLVGDLATERDAVRLRPWAPAAQLTTGGACHLELPLVERAYRQLSGGPFEYLFIEDVGNLVCPASHDLGHHLRVILLSTPEGDDKAGKYPKAFRTSQVLVVTKTDLVPHVPFSVDDAVADARQIQPQLICLSLSALTGEGVPAWLQLLEEFRHRLVEAPHEPRAGC